MSALQLKTLGQPLAIKKLGLLKELIKLPTRADNSQSAREVQGTGQARSMQRNTKQERNL